VTTTRERGAPLEDAVPPAPAIWAGTGAQTATENDSEDLVHLMHLAEPAFLLTQDKRLLKSVDASGTYQAP
jgi:hypothetical protein